MIGKGTVGRLRIGDIRDSGIRHRHSCKAPIGDHVFYSIFERLLACRQKYDVLGHRAAKSRSNVMQPGTRVLAVS